MPQGTSAPSTSSRTPLTPWRASSCRTRSSLDGEGTGFARVYAEKKNGRIVGATLVASHAGDMIAEMSLAVTAGLSRATVGKTIHPYPTQAEAWKRLADAWSRTRLTPRVRGYFERFLRWRR